VVVGYFKILPPLFATDLFGQSIFPADTERERERSRYIKYLPPSTVCTALLRFTINSIFITFIIMDPSPLPLTAGASATAVKAEHNVAATAATAAAQRQPKAEPSTSAAAVPKTNPAAAAAVAAAAAEQAAKKPVKVDEHGNEVEDERVISEEDREKISDEDADEVAYTAYRPAKIGYGRPHPDPVVENSSLGAVQPPDVTCTY